MLKMIHNEFKYLLQSLRYSSRKNQDSTVKEILSSIKNVNEEDLQDLFDLLNHTHDMELQVKLFSILAAHLLSNNDSNNEVIVTYRPLYDRIQEVLSSGLSHRTTTTLNFVTALLSVYSDDESPSPRRKSLALFARNMMRISGCLATISKMFTSCMMYQDTWFALCNCLAEACRGSEINQNYCTHLIPLCVKKCQQVSVEVCALLQSLLHNNDRNIQVFLDNDGLTIFTRELLQNSSCMQLLNTILSKSTQAVNLLSVTHVPQLVCGFVHSHGSHSQIGQWAKVILHHFDSRLRIQTPKYKLVKSDVLEDLNIKSFQDEKCTPDKASVQGTQCSPDETTKLFQNVIKEMVSWKAQSNPRMKNPPNNPFGENDKLRFNFKPNNKFCSSNVDKHWMPKKYELRENDSFVHGNFNGSKDLSFSFLLRQDFRNPSKNGDRVRSVNKSTKINVTTQTDATDMLTNTEATGFQDREINTTHESVIFAPVRASTPKNKHSSFNKTGLSKISRISCSKAQSIYKRKKLGIRKPRKLEEKNSKQELKNTSFSSRLFNAINDSCTTLVKSVKSIFKPNDNKNIEKQFSNNSFTNYMRLRDALLDGKCTKTENTDYEDFSTENEKSDVNSCRTCDDTIILKHKLDNDEYLKQTVKKIKLGINLYGCDFKKISLAMWPQDKYMTPNVLYNLYRKLIVKNIDF